MKFCGLPNFSVQIAIDCILVYSNFQNFLGEHAPLTLLVSPAFGTHHWRYHANIIHIFPVMPHQGKVPGAAPAFSALVSAAEKKALAIRAGKPFSVTLEFFESIISQLLYFCEAKTRGVCMGISDAMANSDNEQSFLDRVINYVDPMGFLSLRKHPFLLALCRWRRFARRNVCNSATEIPY